MARQFSSFGDEVNFGTGVTKLSVSEYTVLAWAFRTGDTNDGRITNRAVGSAAGHMQLSELATNALRMRQDFDTDAVATSQDNFMLLNEWALYVGTLNASKVPRCFRSKPSESVIVEATYAEQTTGVGSIQFRESNEFLIGEAESETRDWIGRLANVSIYDRVLSQGEMLAVKAGVILKGLIFFAPLWGIASLEPDLSPSPLTGTVTGATKVDHAPVGFYAVVA